MNEFLGKLIVDAVLVSNIIFVALFIFALVNKNGREKLFDFLSKYILHIIFLLSSASVLGSLIYSQVIGFSPCVLCWWQRIFLYPQALVSFVAILRKEKQIVFYSIVLSSFGFIISLYQSLVQWGGGSILPCTTEGGECTKLYVYEYGYITIPFMALSVFVYLLVSSVIAIRRK